MIEFRVPPLWRRDKPIGAAVVLRPQHDHTAFRTNVVLNVDHAPASLTCKRRSELVLEHVEATRSEVEHLGAHPVVGVDHEGVAQLVCYDAFGSSLRVAQLHVVLARRCGGGRAVTDFCEVVATTDFAELDRHTWAFTELVQTIRFL